jgi:osmotically inducible protein OsmC
MSEAWGGPCKPAHAQQRGKRTMKRFGSTRWNGGLSEGKGAVSTESRAKPGTNPEELLGAAHAACFTMSFVRMLEMANFVPEQVDSKSDVVIEKDGDGFSITSVHLTVTAKIPGIDRDTFQTDRVEGKGVVPRVQADERRDRSRGHSGRVITAGRSTTDFRLRHPQNGRRAIACAS